MFNEFGDQEQNISPHSILANQVYNVENTILESNKLVIIKVWACEQ